MQLGAGGGTVEPAMPPVPESSEEGDSSPKRRRGESKGPPPRSKKNKAPEKFDWHTLRGLLTEHRDDIVKHNRDHVEQVCQALETKVDARFSQVDATFRDMTDKIQGMEAKVQRLEGLLQGGARAGPIDDMDEKRRATLVFGGWNPDTQRRTILNEVEEALTRLNLKQYTDKAPFTTGPRRSVALLPFELRQGEADSDRKTRMHTVLMGVTEAKAQTSHGKRMWSSYSKSKAQRDISSHCSWVKRSLASFNQELVGHLDLEYGSGTAWLGEYMVASVSRPPPGGVDESEMLWDDRLVARPWIHLGAIARVSGVSTVDLRNGFREFQR
ncbi:DHX57 [Symbiodinium sp. CCMP2592]|nr:DHX57 [Symbiodinium sp. CCMP2592]